MFVSVMGGCFIAMMLGLTVVTSGNVCMVSSLLVASRFMVFCSMLMMLASLLVVHGGFFVCCRGFL